MEAADEQIYGSDLARGNSLAGSRHRLQLRRKSTVLATAQVRDVPQGQVAAWKEWPMAKAWDKLSAETEKPGAWRAT
jgi:hypothetical protein